MSMRMYIYGRENELVFTQNLNQAAAVIACSPWWMTARGLSLFGAAPIKLQISFLFLQTA
jgi:hypothetical protein